MSLWTASILAIVLAYGGLVGALYLGQRKLIYRPESHQPGPEEAGLGRLTVVRYQSADGLELNGWHRPAKPGKPTLLYFQGNAGTFVDRADKVNAFLDHGLGVLLAGYRGYGGNPGRPSEAGLNQDADAALNYLLSQSPKNGEEQIVLYGESLGTAVATALAARNQRRVEEEGLPLLALILESPFTSMAAAAQFHYPWLPAAPLVRDRWDSLARIDRIGLPLLLFHGEADATVPHRMGRQILDRAKEPKIGVFVPQGEHTNLVDHGLTDRVHGYLDALKTTPTP